MKLSSAGGQPGHFPPPEPALAERSFPACGFALQPAEVPAERTCGRPKNGRTAGGDPAERVAGVQSRRQQEALPRLAGQRFQGERIPQRQVHQAPAGQIG